MILDDSLTSHYFKRCIADLEDLFCWYKMKKVISMNYGSSTKQLKTMEMSDAWTGTYNEGYIHQFQPEPNHKIH